MSLLANAIQSIQLGLTDYSCDDDSRLLSAIRNLHSGILLLYKEKLSILSPADSDNALIKKVIIPTKSATGEIKWVGRGKTTVDVAGIRERFDSLGIHTDW